MKKRFWRATLTLGLIACGARSDAAEPGGDTVVVHVDDRAGVRPLVLDQAEKQAARLYKQAGVKMVWRTAPNPGGLGTSLPDQLTVRLVIQARFVGRVAELLRRSTASEGSAPIHLMGAAPQTEVSCGGVVYVFFDQLSAFSNIHQLDSAIVLGTVAAHEVGHVLLRAGHSKEGLMGAAWKPSDWERAAAGLLLFPPDERHAVQRKIAACRGRMM